MLPTQLRVQNCAARVAHSSQLFKPEHPHEPVDRRRTVAVDEHWQKARLKHNRHASDYLDDLQPVQKVALERVRVVVGALAPDAEEGTSYGVPAFIYAGRPLLGFSAAKKHLSIFPFSPAAIEAVRERLDGFDLAKGTIRFSPDVPVPEDVLADLVRARQQEIATKR